MSNDQIEEYSQRMLRHIEQQMLYGDRGVIQSPHGMTTQDYQGSMNPGHTQQVYPHSIAATGMHSVLLCLT